MEVRYDTINTLGEIQFVGGTDQTLTFNTVDQNGTPFVITGATIVWSLAPYGLPNSPEFTKTGSIITTTQFKINLVPADTINLSGKFIHQAMITVGGSVYIPSQGVATITPKIQ